MRAVVRIGHDAGPLAFASAGASVLALAQYAAGSSLPTWWMTVLAALLLVAGGCAWVHWMRPCQTCGYRSAPNSGARSGP